MEDFARWVRLVLARISRSLVPHFRQVLRFLALPYCYIFLVNWKECTASPLRVAGDLLHIFFVMRSFPDNYSICRLYEKPRREWVFYYGSTYNPFQRGRLFKCVQPPEYQIVFEDKEVCQRLCEGLGFVVPRLVGTLKSGRPLVPQLQAALAQEPDGDYFAKPVLGAAGSGVFKITKSDGDILTGGRPLAARGPAPELSERHILQEGVEQDPVMASIYPGSLNSFRVVTLLTRDDTATIISVLSRFGSGSAEIDNWSAGGVAVGVDLETGCMLRTGFNKKGERFLAHPDSGVVFEGFPVPRWSDVRAFAIRVQEAFPYYRLLGLDVAVGTDGPVLVEINAYPDLVGQEQCAGPLLKDPRTLRAFDAYDLLYNRAQKQLLRDLATQE